MLPTGYANHVEEDKRQQAFAACVEIAVQCRILDDSSCGAADAALVKASGSSASKDHLKCRLCRF